jgi:hypothetical protein
MERLGILFGSVVRVKLMRLFLMNSETKFTTKDLVTRSKVTLSAARKELNILRKSELIKDVIIIEQNSRGANKKIKGVMLNPAFPYKETLGELLLQPQTINKPAIVKRFKQIGKIKLLIISGILTGTNDARVDVLVVGKDVDSKKLGRAIKEVEADIGRELVYAAFDTDDFIYRMNMYDKLIADVLDFPHERLIDSMSLSTRRTVN